VQMFAFNIHKNLLYTKVHKQNMFHFEANHDFNIYNYEEL